MKNLEIPQIEILDKPAGIIGAVDWKSLLFPFPKGKVISIPSDYFIKSNNLDKFHSGGHVTYKNKYSGQLAHTKKPDGPYEPVIEPVVSDLATLAGASWAPATAVVVTNDAGVSEVHTASFALLTTTFQEEQTYTLQDLDRKALCKINVVSGWLNNPDGGLQHLAIGTFDGSGCYFYAFDGSHCGSGPHGTNTISMNTSTFWVQQYIPFSLQEYLDAINDIEKIPDRKIKRVCRRWGIKIDQAIKSLSWEHTKMAEQLASLFVSRKYMLRPTVIGMFS